jgi:hypothetical protein
LVTLTWRAGDNSPVDTYHLLLDYAENNNASCKDGWQCDANDTINFPETGTVHTFEQKLGHTYVWGVSAHNSGGDSEVTLSQPFNCGGLSSTVNAGANLANSLIALQAALGKLQQLIGR